jgi:hypothetical protein
LPQDHNGSWYASAPWSHDGRTVESENFVVYSDAASPDARRIAANIGDRILADTIDEMGLDPTRMFRFPPGRDKVDIYLYQNHDPLGWSARAYYGGLIIWSPEHEERGGNTTRFEATFKHELVHVIQWLIEGPNPMPTDVWFLEGLAEALSGGTAGGSIRGFDQLRELTESYGRINPISIKEYSQIDDPHIGEHFYYPMFQLSVEYLMDDEGLRRTPADAALLMLDQANGVPFDDAFAARMGIDLDDYQADFFSRMEAFLPSFRNPLFTTVGYSIFSVVVAATVILILVAVRRRAASRPPSETHPSDGRGLRIAFSVEFALTVLVSVGAFLLATYGVGTTHALYNAFYDATRLALFGILTISLFVTVRILVWALRRLADGSRAALLVAPLVVATAAAASFIISVLT